MTTHELANLLDHLKLGLDGLVKSEAGKGFDEAAAAFRELPDQPLKKLAEQIRNQSGSAPVRKTAKAAVDLPQLIGRIRGVREGAEPLDGLAGQLESLTNDQLKLVLTQFGQKGTTKKADNLERARSLLAVRSETSTEVPAGSPPAGDRQQVDEGVRIYIQLRDNRELSIPDVRAGFEPIRSYSKPVVEEISRQVGYTPHGSRDEILNRLLSNLEGLKMSQMRVDSILTRT